MTRNGTNGKAMKCLPWLAFAALAGCGAKDSAAPPTAPAVVGTPPPCSEKQVKIDSITAPVGKTITVSVEHEPAKLKDGGGGIRWKMKSPNGKTYVFTSDGIAFKSTAPGGAASAAAGHADEYLWCFAATTVGTSWNYAVKFVETSAPTVIWTCDPTIVSSDAIAADHDNPPKTYTCTTP